MKYIQPSSSSNSKWEYSKLLSKLYIDMNTWLQVNIIGLIDWLILIDLLLYLATYILFLNKLYLFLKIEYFVK